MGESTFQTWWELHVRVARGESLTADEAVVYQARRDNLDDGDESQLLLRATHARHDLTALESERLQAELVGLHHFFRRPVLGQGVVERDLFGAQP